MDDPTATYAHHLPGAAISDPEGEQKMAEMAADPKADSLPPQAALVIPTVDHIANGNARDNIVPDGPGTYGEDLAVGPL